MNRIEKASLNGLSGHQYLRFYERDDAKPAAPTGTGNISQFRAVKTPDAKHAASYHQLESFHMHHQISAVLSL